MHSHSTASHGIIDSTSESFSNMSTSLRGSAGRLTRSARQGDKFAVLKIAAVVVLVVGGVWVVGGWVFGLVFGR
jgi:blocked early in transport 1